MTIRQVIAIIFTLIAAGACEVTRVHLTNEGGDAQRFRTDKKEYEMSEPASLILQNTSDVMLGYNLCWSMLERQTNSRWEPVQRDRYCTAVLYTLEAGDTASFEDDLEDIREPGRYRFRTTVEVLSSGDRRDLVTPSFRIE